MSALSFTEVGQLAVSVGDPIIIGPAIGGTRAVVPITGGKLTGLLQGRILPGGHDWAFLLPDGSARVEARYLIELDDGTVLTISNSGLCRPVDGSDSVFAGESVPVFEVGPGAHEWLQRHVFICTFRSDLAAGSVSLTLYRLEAADASTT